MLTLQQIKKCSPVPINTTNICYYGVYNNRYCEQDEKYTIEIHPDHKNDILTHLHEIKHAKDDKRNHKCYRNSTLKCRIIREYRAILFELRYGLRYNLSELVDLLKLINEDSFNKTHQQAYKLIKKTKAYKKAMNL